MPNVKVQFTIRLEDIPKEVKDRVTNLISIYESSGLALQEILDLASQDSPIKMASKIDLLRQDIAFIDSVLQDCYNVIAGYAQYKSNELKQSETTEESAKNE